MNPLIKELHDRIVILADTYRSGDADDATTERLGNDVLQAAAELYRHPEVKLFMPLCKNKMVVFTEEDSSFIILYLTVPEVPDDAIDEYKEVSLKEICDYASDNAYYYGQLSRLDELVGQGNFGEVMDYIEKNPKFDGIILDPLAEYPFTLEGWMLQAVMFKGIGVSFDVIGSETGDVKHKL